MRIPSGKKTYLWSAAAVLLAACAVLTYLFQTGERGLGLRPQSARIIEITRHAASDSLGLGWDSEGLDRVFDHVATLSTDSFMIVTDGQVVATLGDPSTDYNVHSIRKALLSAVVGQHIGRWPDQIPLGATLQELGIDDSPIPLTALQKTATVEHLIKSKSGINHPAAAEGGLAAEKNRRLGRDENQPGTKWAYNNWDYNALTTIFETQTGQTVAEAFYQDIARPTGMKDFTIDAVSYVSDTERSQHKSAAFRMSARDLAIFGQIYLDRGVFGSNQILPATWIERIGTEHTKTGRDDLRWGHGDLWWLPNPAGDLPSGTYWAWGLGNQALFVIPAWNTVIIVQSDTAEFLKRFIPMIEDGKKDGETALEELIRSCFEESNRNSEFCVEHRFTTRSEFEKLISLIAKARILGNRH